MTEQTNFGHDEQLAAIRLRDQQARDAKEVQADEDIQQEQRIKEEDDPREKEGGGGFRGVVKELETVLTGGIQDTASSLVTFPERTIDAFSGEMQRERKNKGEYRPQWSPFTDYENPIVTKTWWGKLLRGVVHFGTMAGGITAAAGAAGISAPASLHFFPVL